VTSIRRACRDEEQEKWWRRMEGHRFVALLLATLLSLTSETLVHSLLVYIVPEADITCLI
jgi:hypothetical protein